MMFLKKLCKQKGFEWRLTCIEIIGVIKSNYHHRRIPAFYLPTRKKILFSIISVERFEH